MLRVSFFLQEAVVFLNALTVPTIVFRVASAAFFTCVLVRMSSLPHGTVCGTDSHYPPLAWVPWHTLCA